MSEQAVDVRAVVAEIEHEVAGRRAAGEYDPALLRRLSVEFHVEDREEPLEALAQIITHRIDVGARPPLDRAIIFVKKVLRRGMAWYVQPVAVQQTRFNFAVARDLRALERRLARQETPWVRPARGVPVAAVPATRSADLVARLSGLEDSVLVLGAPASDLLAALRSAEVDATGDDGEVLEARGRRLGDPLDQLEECEAESLGAICVPGLLPLMSAAELVSLAPLALSRLRRGGLLWLDAPDPSAAGAPAEVAAVDPAMLRWVPADTATLLAEAAGFTGIEVRRHDGWYALTATRPL